MSGAESERRAGGRWSRTKLGRYRLGARLGAGGAASVYLGRLTGPHGFERLLAIKVIHEHLLDQSEFVDMFLDEANLVVRLSHPNIVHVYELGREDETLYMAMEFLRGQPLSKVYRRALANSGPLDLDVVAWIGARAAEALHHAHELKDDVGQSLGLVHRDVSPENLFITYDGHVKLIDFGIARARGRVAQTGMGGLKGKYRYMSPEQALGQEVDRRTDIFALGATLYEAGTGRPVFPGEDEVETLGQIIAGEMRPPAELRADFSEDLSDVLMRALSSDVDERFTDAEDLAQRLDAVAAAGAGGQRERLAELMQRLFAEERRAEEKAVTDLRSLEEEDHDVRPSGATQLVASQTLNRLSTRRSRRLWPVGIIAGLGVAAAAAILVLRPEAPVETAEVPAKVNIDIAVQPKVPAKIEVDGQPVSGSPARVSATMGETPMQITARADGYEVAELTVIPDRNHFIVLPLTKLPVVHKKVEAPVPAPSASAAAEPPAPAKPIRRAKPAVKTAKPATKPPDKPQQTKTTSPSLIKKFPF